MQTVLLHFMGTSSMVFILVQRATMVPGVLLAFLDRLVLRLVDGTMALLVV